MAPVVPVTLRFLDNESGSEGHTSGVHENSVSSKEGYRWGETYEVGGVPIVVADSVDVSGTSRNGDGSSSRGNHGDVVGDDDRITDGSGGFDDGPSVNEGSVVIATKTKNGGTGSSNADDRIPEVRARPILSTNINIGVTVVEDKDRLSTSTCVDVTVDGHGGGTIDVR